MKVGDDRPGRMGNNKRPRRSQIVTLMKGARGCNKKSLYDPELGKDSVKDSIVQFLSTPVTGQGMN